MTGADLREMRERAGLKAKDVAEKLGLSAEHVSRIENGHRLPSKIMIVAWEVVCGHLKPAH